ncbi:hypothetical protein [Nocardia sp. NPDC020380]|uniref:hypothetical protein n=1 Tax=Nocardia sp. NPDC020380 TaxID=3364309 RepID=UPI003799EFE9
MKNNIRIAAVAFLVLGVGYYFWHGLTSDDMLPWVGWQMGLPIAALTVVPIAFAFTGDGILSAMTGKNSSAYRNALVGLGTIESFAQTGVYLNEQPQVKITFRVEGAHGETFPAQARMIVPLTELALLRPGVVLPVRYLPERPGRVEVDMSGNTAAAQEAMNQAMIRKGFTTQAKLDIARRGIAAQAVVRALSVPGEIRDGHTRVNLELVVNRPDGSTFATHMDKFLQPALVGRVQVGRIVQVHYLPENEQEVVLSLPVNAG